MSENEILKSKRSAPDTKSWYEYIWREQQETPQRLEDAAKFLATMISISLSIFLAMGKTSFENGENNLLLKVCIFLWLLSLLVSFLVLFPWRYSYSSISVSSIKEMHHKVVRDKYRLLVISLLLFLAALSILACLFLF